MSGAGMEEFLESPMLLLQAGVAIAVPAVLAAIVNIGCGKKRDQPVRPGGPGGKSNLSKSKAGGVAASTKSAKSKRSTKSAGSAKSGKSSKKAGKSKRSSKSVDKSGKSGKSGKKSSSKGSKGSKSSKSKKSKRDIKQQKTGPPSSSDLKQQQQQSQSARTAIEAENRSAKQAATHAAAALAHENSAKSAATQLSASSKQPPSGGLDANANAIGGTTALVAIGGGTVYPTLNEDPIIPLELQLMHNFYAQKCIPFGGDDTSKCHRAMMLVPPRSLFDSTRELKMEPAELRWSSAGGMQKISLLNQSNERQAVKVKCSDNNVYRVNPVYAIVEPGQTLNVDVMRQNGSNKVDKIVFVTTRAGLEENPKNLFKPGTQSSMMVLPLLASSTAASANYQPALAAAN